MKHLFSINELFNSDATDVSVISANFNPSSLSNGATINLLIKDIPYAFKTCIRNNGEGDFIYLSYHIFNHSEFVSDKSKNNFTDYEFIVNKSMMIPVLNALPIFLEEYKKLLLEKGMNFLISGFYYDADEYKRRKIYQYYFKNKLGNRLKNNEKGASHFIFVELKEPVLLENLYL